ncbi:DUF937 domain-containing protein [Deinococcus frigens]|uniref:DUF937 domain-containing protein n=1 Tax=Deinococcus frigens TaxID=249403 RepID=UPI00049630FC|nr:DUF937 domain-containing protein [Deinococcus frigens]
MMDIFNMLGGMSNAQQQVSQQTGATPQQSESAMEAAIPLLLGAMTRNASNPNGAASLTDALGQHDGSALDMFSRGNASSMQEGQKILGHVFGNQQQSAANAVSKRAGIDPQLAMQILSMAAPLVLGYLARQRRQGGGQQGQGGGDIGSILGGLLGGGAAGGMGGMLGGLLGGGQQAPQPQMQDQRGGVLGGGPVISGLPQQNAPAQQGGAGGMIGTLNNVLDRDGDGNALNDLIGMFGGRR